MWKFLLGLELGPSLQPERGMGPCLPLPPTAPGRCPCGLITPCRGASPGLVLVCTVLSYLRRSLNGGLLQGLLADALLCGIMIGSYLLGCPRTRSIARINI